MTKEEKKKKKEGNKQESEVTALVFCEIRWSENLLGILISSPSPKLQLPNIRNHSGWDVGVDTIGAKAKAQIQHWV